MEWTADRFNLVCLAVEYRQSGYDFNPVTGFGACCPYDASFLQTFDVLNALRVVLDQYPHLNRRRLVHYGSSQGGHISLLSAIFAPDTFAFIYPSCPVVHLTPVIVSWAGRAFARHELSVRNVLEHSQQIKCPIVIEYGTADTDVPPSQHAEPLINQLHGRNHPVEVAVYEGGGHSLEPTITKLAAFQQMASKPMETLSSNKPDDFTAGSIINILCGNKTLEINWSRDDPELAVWK
jgi:fermentation-respiration switch protein FrsA (DUF1100 family)